MGTTADKLNKVLQTKEAIRTAINNKGGTLTETDKFSDYATAIDNIQSGGGEEKSIYVDFLDGDGTLLKREYLNEGGTATLPDNPNLDSNYLTFSGWSNTELTNITESKTIYATYTTKDNATYIFIHIPAANNEINLSYFKGTITSVDWGDGTIDATKYHTYSAIGDYVVKIIGGTSIAYYILGSETGNSYILKCYLANTISELSDHVFSRSYALTNIVLPNTITKIDIQAFQDCHSLKSIILPDTIINLGGYVLDSCYSLRSVALPSTITSINNTLFQSCYALTNIILPNTIKSLGSYIFNNCTSLTSINIPSGITEIRDNIFSACYSLKNITLPNNIKSISSSAFSSCYSLKNITLPNTITSIGSSAFSGCRSLTSITLPNNITKLEDYIFSRCYSLTSISLPSSVTTIGYDTFNECYSLQQVVINAATVVTIQSSTFSKTTYGTKFYVPDNLVEDYKVATNWVNFADRIYPLSSLGV